MAAKRGLVQVVDAGRALEAAVSDHLTKHVACYTDRMVRPKHHWAFDLAAQLQNCGYVVDAFVIERQHLLVKGVADHVRDTTRYETSVLASVLNLQHQQLADRTSFAFDKLEKPVRPLDEAPDVMVSKKMTINTLTVCVDDVVVRGADVAVVVACADDGSGLFLFVSPFVVAARITDQATRVRPSTAFAVWRAADIELALAWRAEPDGSLVVIRN